jgi:hypothetical protein
MLFGIKIRNRLGREMAFSVREPKRPPQEFFNKICTDQISGEKMQNIIRYALAISAVLAIGAWGVHAAPQANKPIKHCHYVPNCVTKYRTCPPPPTAKPGGPPPGGQQQKPSCKPGVPYQSCSGQKLVCSDAN